MFNKESEILSVNNVFILIKGKVKKRSKLYKY
jgi:hypothetical protein